MSDSSKQQPPSPDRRNFLKGSTLAVLGATMPAPSAIASAAMPGPARDAQPNTGGAVSDAVSLVNLLQGTASTGDFSRGNTLPIAAMPFGMAHWTLQSFADTEWMFHPGVRRIQGFRSTHQLSPWLGDYGHAVFLPFSGKVDPRPNARSTSYRPEDAELHPHSMRMRLLRYSIDAELIPTERCALMAISYSDQENRGFLFDVPGGKPDDVHQDAAGRTIRFTSSANAGGVPQGFACYYVMKFSTPWEKLEHTPSKNSCISLVHFSLNTQSLEVHIATSFISYEQATLNLDQEIGSTSIEGLRKRGADTWNEHLGRIEISGGTPEQQKTFYSCLYRTLLFPRMWHEPDSNGGVHHRSPYKGTIEPGVMYADHGYWDVYRAWYPLMSLLFQERLGEILQSWVNAYKEGGWLPQFPCPGYRACMTGSLIDSVFGEAAAKGIKGFDMESAYAGLKKHATQPGDPAAGYGRRGIEEYLKLGYVPEDRVEQSVAETTDAAYGDYCIAQVAKALGNTADYEMFMKRSTNWRHVFDKEIGFPRGKQSDGKWLEPFDPFKWGSPYVEGGPWQHRWDAPHDMPGLIAALGGNEKAVATLEQMITMSTDFHIGSYGYEIHEMSEMAAVPFGQYAHSNQPVHHVLGVFAVAGRPDRTRYWTRRVMDDLYSSSSFAGDEDTGSMAAWYVINALGLFVLCPAKPEYILSAPLFPQATVHLENGKSLVIDDRTAQKQKASVTFNHQRITATTIAHADLLQGGNLTFS